MTSREDRLDAFLNRQFGPSNQQPPLSDDPSPPPMSGNLNDPPDQDPAVLAGIANDLRASVGVQPRAAFEDGLRAKLRAHAAALRLEQGAGERSVPVLTSTPAAPDAVPNASAHSAYQRSSEYQPPDGHQSPGVRVLAAVRGHRRTPSLRWLAPLAAAVLVLALSGVVVAGAFAHPGTPLYALHGVVTNLARQFESPSAKAQSYLDAARQDLADLRAASGQGGANNGVSYAAALDDMRKDTWNAADQIQKVPSAADQSRLADALSALRNDETSALWAALPNIKWSDRVTTTSALADLGVVVLQVTSASVTQGHGQSQIIINGSGFQQSAVLLVNGRAVGDVISLTSTQLIAQAPSGLIKQGFVMLGVGNPDGTAATAPSAQFVAAPTETPNGHGSNAKNGDATPTPTSGGTPEPITTPQG